MICYRAETALANLLSVHYKRSDDEIRMLVKAVINQTIDIIPGHNENLLRVTIYPLANNRSNVALGKVLEQINDRNTIFPNTNLIMRFNIATV